MAPITIPGRVTQGPTLTMVPHQLPGYTAQDVAGTPGIFWVMMALGGILGTFLLGFFLIGIMKHYYSSIVDILAYYANVVKAALFSLIKRVSRRTNALLPRRLRTRKSKATLPTSVNSFATRPFIMPTLKSSLAMPTRAFGASIREKVHSSYGYEKTSGTKFESSYKSKITVTLPSLPQRTHNPRTSNIFKKPHTPNWVSAVLEWKPTSSLRVPDIKIWGPGEEPSRREEPQHARPQSTPGDCCTIEELMAFYGIDDAYMEAISKKPWIVYHHKPLSTTMQADDKSSSDTVDTPPLSPAGSCTSSDGTCSPATPDASIFDPLSSLIPDIRIIEPAEHDLSGSEGFIADSHFYGIPPLSQVELDTLATPPLSPAPIPITLSATLESSSYLQPPENTFKSKRSRSKDTDGHSKKGKMFNLADPRRGRPLIFAAAKNGVAQSVGMGREGVRKGKGRGHGLGLGEVGTTLGGIEEREESEEDDEQVLTRDTANTIPDIPSAPAPKASTESRILDPRPVTDLIRTSTSSRRAPLLPSNRLPGARPQFSSSTPPPTSNLNAHRAEGIQAGFKNGAGSAKKATSTTRNLFTPPQRSAPGSSARTSPSDSPHTKKPASLLSPKLPSTPPTPFQRSISRSTPPPRSSPPPSAPRTGSRASPQRSTINVSNTSHLSHSSRTTSLPPPTESPTIPQLPSPPSRTRKVVTKPPVPRYRPVGV